jgi:hypothetical protein
MAMDEGLGPAAIGEPEISVSFPEAIAKIDRVLSFALATYRNFPEAPTRSATGLGVGNGDPATAVNPPELVLIEYADISPEPSFATYRKLPFPSMVSANGVMPVFVRGWTSVSAPEVPRVNKEMSFSCEFTT